MSSRTTRTKSIISLAALLTSSWCFAVDEAKPPKYTLELDAGYSWNYLKVAKDESYYRITALGNLLREGGKPIPIPTPGTFSGSTVQTDAGSNHAWQLRLESSTGSLGGGLFEASGLQPLKLSGLEQTGLRGFLYTGGDKDGKNIQFSAGLKSKEIRLISPKANLKSSITNWLVLGLFTSKQESTESSTGDREAATLWGEAFLGKYEGWRPSQAAAKAELHRAQKTLQDLVDYDSVLRGLKDKSGGEFTYRKECFATFRTLSGMDDAEFEYRSGIAGSLSSDEESAFAKALLDDSPGQILEAAKAYAASIESKAALSGWRLVLVDKVHHYFNESWALAVRSTGDVLANSAWVPTFAWSVSGNAWYDTVRLCDGPRVKHMLSANLDWWLIPDRKDMFLRVRYENGYERAAPTDKRNHLLVSLSIRM